MKPWVRRIWFGGIFAIPMAMLAFAFVQLPAQAQPVGEGSTTCQNCHPAFRDAWMSGAHGQAAIDPIFLDAWEMVDEDPQCLSCHTTGFNLASGTYEEEGVTCAACHDATLTTHPNEPMTTNRAPDLCGACHTETYFEWQVSRHYQEDLSCIDCHDPHGTDLKSYDESSLCSTCHRSRASNFTHTEHNAQGLTCADCHLSQSDEQPGEGHSLRDHSFDVKLESCYECHAYQLHDPLEAPPTEATEPDAMASVEGASVAREPTGISPVGFAMLSGLVGMASGMILAPWLERWYQRIREE